MNPERTAFWNLFHRKQRPEIQAIIDKYVERVPDIENWPDTQIYNFDKMLALTGHTLDEEETPHPRDREVQPQVDFADYNDPINVALHADLAMDLIRTAHRLDSEGRFAESDAALDALTL